MKYGILSGFAFWLSIFFFAAVVMIILDGRKAMATCELEHSHDTCVALLR